MSGVVVDVRTDVNALVLTLRDLKQQTIDGATVRALNRTATTVRAEAARLIREEYNLKVGTIKDQIRIERATRQRLAAKVIASGRPIPLIEFSPNQTRDGVTVKVKQSRKLIRHAFIATMPSGHQGVYIRRGFGNDRAPRLPIDQLFSISLPVAFTRKQILKALVDVVRRRFPEAFRQEARFIMLKKAA